MKKPKAPKVPKTQAAGKPQAAVVQLEAKPESFRKYYYVLGILVFFLFANTISNGYNLDDELVTRNHKLTSRGLEAVKDIFTSPYYSDDMGYAYGYRPIVHLFFALEHDLFGEKPGVSHFLNVLLYAFAVVLFFKLLLKWAGEKQIVFAMLAAILFAIHPIHTEVVDSIKNRDEILAFLFVICAAFSMEKYLIKGKIISLLWMFVFFALAMLSKKSVFPLAVILPLVAIFLKSASLRQVFFISVALLIPAAVVGSELEIIRMSAIFVLGALLIAATFFIRSSNWEIVKNVLMDYRLICAISLAILGYGMWINEVLLYFAAAIFLIIFYKRNKRVIAIVFFAEGLIAFFFFLFLNYGAYEIAVLNLLVSSYLIFAQLMQKKYDWTIIAIAVIFAGAFAYGDFRHLYMAAAIFMFSFLIHKKWMFGAIYAASILILQIVLSGYPFYGTLFIIVSVLQMLHGSWKKLEVVPVLVVSGMVAACIFLAPVIKEVYDYNHTLAIVDVKAKVQKADQSFLKEGRKLEFVENTLVEPHTPVEAFATGAATLGEYTQLMLFPYELSFYYGYAKTKTVSLQNPWVWISVLVHLLLITLALWQLKKRPLLSLGIAWYLACILLFSNWLELVAGMVGERLAFTASAGFCIFIASLLLWIKPNLSFKKPGAVEFTLIAVALLLTGKTVVRNTNWKSPLVLMSHDITHLGNSAQANNLYALNLMRSSVEDPDQTREEQVEKQKLAIEHFDRAVQIWPGFFNAAYDKGRAGMALQDTTVAIDGFEKAVEIGNNDFLELYYQLGDLYIQKKRNKDFLLLSKKIYAMSNDKPDGYSVLARGYFLNQYLDSAKLILENGVLKFPSNPDIKRNLEMVNATIK